MDYKVMVSSKFLNMSIVASFMVILIHVLKRCQQPGSVVAYFRYFTGEGMCRIAVPFFFMAAGFFIASHIGDVGYWRQEVAKRLKSLVLPFITWSLVTFILRSCLITINNLTQGVSWERGLFTCERLLRVMGLDLFSVPESRQLWFVRVLFIFVVFLPLFKIFASRYGGVILIFAAYLLFKAWGGGH